MNTCPNCDVPGAATVIAAVPLCPSLVAVIVADPAATPVTSPLPLTVAAAVLLLCHVTVRPASELPFASLGVAVSCTVLPVVTVADAGVTVTEATGRCTTVMAEVPLCPSLVAVIVADPATTPLTNPLALTVAAELLLLDQVIDRPVRTLPFASLRVAVSCCVWPSFSVADAGATVTEATGVCTTVMAEVPLWPSLVAVIVADPATTPVTNPLALTVAAELLLLDQVIDRPVRMLPFASLRVAVSCCVWPSFSVADAGARVTVATGTGGWLPAIAKLHTVWLPVIAVSVQLASEVTAACSVRNAKPVPIVCSALPAGVT